MNFLDKYDNEKNIRFPFFKRALQIAHDRELKIFVETGTSRGKEKFFFFKKINWKDGMSTLIFADFVSKIDGELHTCDISEKNINNAKDFTKEFSKNIFFYIDDSINFLKNFKSCIDFLYLDSFDGHNVELASKHQLKEAQNALDKLNDKSIIMLDDKGAKTLYSLNFLAENGFKPIHESENQILLSRYK